MPRPRPGLSSSYTPGRRGVDWHDGGVSVGGTALPAPFRPHPRLTRPRAYSAEAATAAECSWVSPLVSFVIRSPRRRFGCGKPICNLQLRRHKYWDKRELGENDRYDVTLRPSGRALPSWSRRSVAIGRGPPSEAVE